MKLMETEIKDAYIKIKMKCLCSPTSTMIIEQPLYAEMRFTCCRCNTTYKISFEKIKE